MPEPAPVLITDPVSLKNLAATLQAGPRAAVDTESNSLHAYRERVCLLQISTADRDYLVDPLAVPDLTPLSEFFQDPRIEKVFHAAEYDLICLQRDFQFRVRGLFDTHAAARALGIKSFGLSALLECEFGEILDKKMQRADWGARPLTARQVEYARRDTHYLLGLRDRLAERIEANGLWPELREEFERLESIPENGNPEPAIDPFWRIRGAAEMPPDQRAILRELFEWREKKAEQIDKPPFHVISEDALIRLAETAPGTDEELKAAGIPDRILKRSGLEILDAVRRGRNRKAPSPERAPRMDDSAMNRLETLRKWRKQKALARGVESDVILSRDMLYRIARLGPGSLDALRSIPGFGPWHLDTYGQEILAVIKTRKT